MAAPDKLAALRHLLAERFPTASRPASGVLPTGLPTFDELTGGGLPLSALTEVVCAAPSCGSHLLLGQLLHISRASRQRCALIDSMDAFDPSSHAPDDLNHLIWVRCQTTAQALQAADLFARDANLGLVFLDLRHAPAADLRRISGPQWYRLQRAVESTDLALVVQTPRPTVPSAQLRLVLDRSFTLDSLNEERPRLSAQLAPSIHRQRLKSATG
jgi:hypothetical protein